MIFRLCTTRHVGFLTLLFDVDGTLKEDPKWGKSEKAGRVEERLFQQQRKSTTTQYANHANPSSITEVTRFWTQAYAAGNNSKLALYRLRILNQADRDRDHYCFLFAKVCHIGVKTSVKLATKVSYSSTFAVCSFLWIVWVRKQTCIRPTVWTKSYESDVFRNVGTPSKMEKALVKVWNLSYV